LLQDDDGQIALTHSVSAGLDYSGVGPEHCYFRDRERTEYTFATDDEAIEGFQRLSQTEGIIPALESAHAIAEVCKLAPQMGKDELVLVNLSGRGDKDVQQAAQFIEGIL
jgi:tryptophan synthase beta chain